MHYHISSESLEETETSRAIKMLPPAVAAAELVKQIDTSTTFVQTEKESFREVVQKYTGAGDSFQGKLPVTCKPGTSSKVDNTTKNGCDGSQRHQTFKLHERRNKGGKEMKLEIKHNPYFFKRNSASPRSSDGLSPTLQDRYSSVMSSPVTPLSALSLESSECSNPRTPLDHSGVDRLETRLDQSKPFIIDRSSFQIIPLPHRKSEPELLNLFPLVSPRKSQAED